VPAALAAASDGVSRISTIVNAMREFAHPDRVAMEPADLNRALETTLTIARNAYKRVADVETEFGELPPVVCHVGELNQVFLNLLVNAAHAITDVVGDSGTRGLIRLRTAHEGDHVRIDITDSGVGIPAENRARIFEPFFTTRAVGKGSGQGLAIAYAIVTGKHGGQLSCVSEVGRGSTFSLRLAVGGPPAASAATAGDDAHSPARAA
jgi:signal transduction histidine kinase